ncbi:PAS domain S-box protein [Desulfocurvus sp. DL9XJH121]
MPSMFSAPGFPRVAHLRRTMAFLVTLVVVLFVVGFGISRLMQLENKRAAQELSARLVAEQIRITLNERIDMAQRLARNPTIIQMYEDGDAGSLDSRVLLNTVNEMAATSLIYTLSATGRTFASADSQEALLVGKNYSFRPYFHQAMAGEIAVYPAQGFYTGRRGIHIAVPIHGAGGAHPIGVLVMKIGMTEIDEILAAQEEKLAMVSPDGVILSTNQSDWLLHSLMPLSPGARLRLRDSRQFGAGEIEALDVDLTGERVRMDRAAYSIAREPLPIPGWYILSCDRSQPLEPLTPFQQFQILGGLSVTGGMAVLIFFLAVNIQHRKFTEKMLRRAEEKYRSIFENAVMGVYQSTTAGRFFEASPSMARILGYDSPADLIESVHDMRDIYYNPYDRDVWLNLLAEREQFSGFETRYLKKDGTPIWVSLSSRLAVGEDREEQFIEGFCLDVSDKKEAVEALKRERDILSRIMATSPASIILSDGEGRVTYANAHAEALLGIRPQPGSDAGYSPPEFTMLDPEGKLLSDHEQPARRARSRRTIVRNQRCILQWADGRQVVVSVSVAPMFDREGRVAEMVSLFEDITKMVRAEKEAAEQQQQLFEADRMIAMGILTSGIAHEINNPNTYILSSAQTLSDAWKEAKVVLDEYYEENGDFIIGGIPYSAMRETLPSLNDRILDGSRRIGRIIKELLVFSRRESIGTTEALDLNKVIRTSEILLSSMIKKSTHSFEMLLAPGEVFIQGNFQRLEQVLINIIQNALQALPGPDKGIVVESRVDQARGTAQIVVRDQGVGISDKDLARVMDPFFTTKRETGGTGLGLAVSSTIVHDLGGSMHFDSQEGIGTTVTLTFPLKDRPAPTGGRHAAAL